MKTAIVKTATILLAFITSFLPGFSQANSSYFKNGETPAEVKFLGMIKQDPLFNLNLNNATFEEFVITVKNEEGVSLYSEKIKGTNLSRKYQINILDDTSLESFNIRFEVLNVGNNKTSIYTVRSKTQLLESFLIAKL